MIQDLNPGFSASLRLWLLVSLYLCVPSLFAQDSHVGIGYTAIDVSGSEQAWMRQYNLEEGVMLDSLHYQIDGRDGHFDQFRIDAHGFGDDPRSHARFQIHKDGVYKAQLQFVLREYQRPAVDITSRAWDKQTIKADITYEKSSRFRWRLRALNTSRDGDLGQWFYGLGEPYARTRHLDERLWEYGIGLETRTLPVKIVLEQAFSGYRADHSYSPANDGQSRDGDVDIFSGTAGELREERSAPVTRLGLSYAKRRFSFAAFGLWRADDLEITRNDQTVYDLVGGTVGRVRYIDDLVSDGDHDSNLANARLSYMLAPSWLVHLNADFRDRKLRSDLVGSSGVVLEGNGTEVPIEEDVDTLSRFDQKNEDIALGLEYRKRALSVHFEAEDSRWEQRWHQDDQVVEARQREGDVYRLRLNYRPDRKLRAIVKLESGSFGHTIFRNDPQDTNSAEVKLRYRHSDHISTSFGGGYEEAKSDEQSVDRSLRQLNFGVTWSHGKDARVDFYLSHIKLESTTGISFYAPELVGDFSYYESDLNYAALNLQAPVHERIIIKGGLTHFEDQGASVPLRHDEGYLGLLLEIMPNLEGELRFRRYDHEGPDETEDYRTDLYGFVLRRRF